MFDVPTVSAADMRPGQSLAHRLAGSLSRECLFARFLVPMEEIEGAAIGYSFRDLERLRDSVGPEWLAMIFAGLDQKDPVIVRSMVELGIRGATPDDVLEAVALDRLSEYVAAALLLRLKR